MRRTGKRSGTRSLPAPAAALLAAILLTTAVVPGATALDFFTLWRQPQIPLRIREGAWIDYRAQVMAGGRREESLMRLSCLERADGSDERTWVLELLPLTHDESGARVPVAGEGTRLRVSRDLLRRQGTLLEAVLEVRQWRDGQSRILDPRELQDDPLVSASLTAEFRADRIETGAPTTRVIDGRQLLCRQFVFSAADSQGADLPAGRMIQISTWEITAAVDSTIPFLGLAFVAERVRAESRLDPPSRRFSPPAPRAKVEIMECLAFGSGARPHLLAAD